MKPDSEMGVVKSISRVEDDAGRTVLQAIIHFYDGNCPDLTPATVWECAPVKIVECSVSTDAAHIKT